MAHGDAMAEEEEHELHMPHDRLFAATFGVPANAAAFLRPNLPVKVAEAVSWEELQLLSGSFVDSAFKASHTDLLFSAPIDGRHGLLYLLFEHQSTPDPALPLRLLRYVTRIWERCLAEDGGDAKLPVVLPVVLSQNAQAWDVPNRLNAMLDIPAQLAADLAPFIPDFEYRHLQLADVPFDAIPGTPSGILVLRVMKAERIGRLLDAVVWDPDLMDSAPLGLLQMVLRYMLSADIDTQGFIAKIGELRHAESRRSAMTLAQRFRHEGRQEGRAEGFHTALQLAVVEALELRFERTPDGLREAVEGIQDDGTLRDLLRAAIRCQSIEEFARLL